MNDFFLRATDVRISSEICIFLLLIMIQKLANAKWSNGLQVLHLPFPYGNPACLWLNTIFHGLFLQ